MTSHPAYYARYAAAERIPSGIFFRSDLLSGGIYPAMDHEHGIGPCSFPTFQQVDSGYDSPAHASHTRTVGWSDDNLSGADCHPGGGLTGNVQCLPLLNVDIDVHVNSTIARTQVTQTFTNLTAFRINEASYCFPLYDGSTVVSFRCHTGEDKVLEGLVKPKETARTEFKEAIAKQKVAALLEEHTPEVFETHLGNIPAKSTVKVEITYVNELKADIGGDGILMTIPTSVAPRYGTLPDGMTVSSGTARNGLRITANIAAAVPLRTLESQTHPISVEMGTATVPAPAANFADLASPADKRTDEFNPKKARATLSERTATLSKDFVLLILTAEPSMLASRALLEMASGIGSQSAMMVSLNPRDFFSNAEPNMFRGEIIFIADRSGSMYGTKMDTLRDALKFFLKSIPSEDVHFNIYSFGSMHTSLWPTSQPYTQEALNIAMSYVSSFDADMGGTEIFQPVWHAVQQRIVKDGSSTQVIVITDGEVWNTEQTTHFVKTTRDQFKDAVRFFALGIGGQVSHQLVEGIGRLGGGFAEVVAVDSGGRWEERVIRMLKGALMPASLNCEIEFEGTSTTTACSGAKGSTFMQAPYKIPPLHPFTRFSVYFLFDKKFETSLGVITVKIATPSGRMVAVPIPVEQVDDSAFTVHYLAAKALILDLESGQSWLHFSSRSKNDSLNSFVKELGERIGMRYSITSEWTSFIALEKKTREENSARLYKAPRVELALLSRARSAPVAAGSSAGSALTQGAYVPQNTLVRSGAEACMWMQAQRQQCMPIQAQQAQQPQSMSRQAQQAQQAAVNPPRTQKKHPKRLSTELRSVRTGSKSNSDPDVRAFCSFGVNNDLPGLTASELGDAEYVSHYAATTPSLFHCSAQGYGNAVFRPDVFDCASYSYESSTLSSDFSAPPELQPEGASPPNPQCRPESSANNPNVHLDSLVGAQQASGSFRLPSTVAQDLEMQFGSTFSKSLLEHTQNLEPQMNTSDELRHTVMVVVYIKKAFAAQKELWELLILKSERWVAAQIASEDVRRQIWEMVEKAWNGRK